MCCLEFDNEKSHNLTARIMHALMPSLSFPWYIYLIFDTLPVFPIHTWKIPILPSPTLVNSFHMYQNIFLLDTKNNPILLYLYLILEYIFQGWVEHQNPEHRASTSIESPSMSEHEHVLLIQVRASSEHERAFRASLMQLTQFFQN